MTDTSSLKHYSETWKCKTIVSVNWLERNVPDKKEKIRFVLMIYLIIICRKQYKLLSVNLTPDIIFGNNIFGNDNVIHWHPAFIHPLLQIRLLRIFKF